jgi:CheY-like chemotaxis protein
LKITSLAPALVEAPVEFLDELADWLQSTEAPGTSRMRAAAARHAAQRVDHSFQLTQLVHESPASAGEEASVATTTPGTFVLVIEDNVDAAETLAEILELSGHRVRLAYDGTIGIQMARELKPEVVLCDIGLPDVNGYEVARTLRAEQSLRSTRLIAVTGYAQYADKQKAVDAGFDAHLTKPPDLDKLIKLLSKEAAANASPPKDVR